MIHDLKITVLRAFHPDEVYGDNYPITKQDWMGMRERNLLNLTIALLGKNQLTPYYTRSKTD